MRSLVALCCFVVSGMVGAFVAGACYQAERYTWIAGVMWAFGCTVFAFLIASHREAYAKHLDSEIERIIEEDRMRKAQL